MCLRKANLAYRIEKVPGQHKTRTKIAIISLYINEASRVGVNQIFIYHVTVTLVQLVRWKNKFQWVSITYVRLVFIFVSMWEPDKIKLW